MKKKIGLILGTAALAAGIAIAVFLIHGNQQKESAYREAVQYVRDGEALQAYRLFQTIRNYRDADLQMAILAEKDKSLPYRVLGKGDCVEFGRWEQDHHEDNGPEPIEWIVLDKIEGQLLLLSSDCLAGKAYHTESFAPVTWETCSLRKWLNEDFLNTAFSETERAWIPVVENENPDHSLVETPGGDNTKDRVFLLCERDTTIYLRNEADQQAFGRAMASQAAQAAGLQVDEEGYASWWLRSPGMYEYIAQYVDPDGEPYSNGASTDIDYMIGVRPVIWLDAKGDQQ